MGASLWSEEGYLLDIAQFDEVPTISTAQTCHHQVRQLILRNTQRCKSATICCSKRFFCSVCFTLITNSGVARILFPVTEGSQKIFFIFMLTTIHRRKERYRKGPRYFVIIFLCAYPQLTFLRCFLVDC